jgi:hypothetical protein
MPCIRTRRLHRSTCCPVALALLQARRERQLLVSRPQWLYLNYVVRSGGSARRAARRRLLRLTRLVVDYFVYDARLGASARCVACGSSSTTSPTPRIRVPRHVARHVARLVVDYFASLGS